MASELQKAVERLTELADVIEDHLSGSPGNFEIARSELWETASSLRAILNALPLPQGGGDE